MSCSDDLTFINLNSCAIAAHVADIARFLQLSLDFSIDKCLAGFIIEDETQR